MNEDRINSPQPQNKFQRFVIERLQHQDLELDAILRILNAMNRGNPELKAEIAKLSGKSATLKAAIEEASQ